MRLAGLRDKVSSLPITPDYGHHLLWYSFCKNHRKLFYEKHGNRLSISWLTGNAMSAFRAILVETKLCSNLIHTSFLLEPIGWIQRQKNTFKAIWMLLWAKLIWNSGKHLASQKSILGGDAVLIQIRFYLRYEYFRTFWETQLWNIRGSGGGHDHMTSARTSPSFETTAGCKIINRNDFSIAPLGL